MNSKIIKNSIVSIYGHNTIKSGIKRFNDSKYLILLFLPGLLYYIIFRYLPMYGVIIAFKKFEIMKGIVGSKWIGFDNFILFFKNPHAYRLIRNTFLLSINSLVFGFPAPIILALLLNEIKIQKIKRTIQSITYLPHFISMVIVVGMLVNFMSPSGGIINTFIQMLGGEKIFFLREPQWFRAIYVGSGIWQETGWGGIIYMAALSAIDPMLYEASTIDGANRWKKMIHITIPGIIPTFVILLILRLGNLMEVGFQKVLLMYNPLLYETADIISTFVYRRGIIGADFSFATAIDLMNSFIGLILIILANKISRKLTETSLW